MAVAYQTLCPNCFQTAFPGGTCSVCGYNAIEMPENAIVLPPGSLLNGRYIVGRVLGIGGFGITYLAKNNKDRSICAIKEYFPSTIATRGNDATVTSGSNNQKPFKRGLERFLAEADTLKKFMGNPLIVQVYHAFQENETAYFAMEYLNGVTARALTKSMGMRLPYELAMEILLNITEALQYVHNRGLLHRDVNPDNIFVTSDGQVKLIDFGATRNFVGDTSSNLSVVFRPGYAPPEQYSSKGMQGPWTDIYSLAATFYYLSSGQTIPDAPARMNGTGFPPLIDIVNGMSPAISEVVNVALHLNPDERFQTVDNFLSVVWTEVSQLAGSQVQRPQRPKPPAQQQQQHRSQPQQQSVPQQRPQPPQQQVQRPVRAPAQPPQPLYQNRNVPQQAHGTPYLLVTSGTYKGNKWAIPGNMEIVIGRSAEQCNIVLNDPNISRTHCSVRFDQKNGCFYIKDTSSNGTYSATGQRYAAGAFNAVNPDSQFYLSTADFMFKAGLE